MTARPPFDPSRIRRPAPAAAALPGVPLSVQQVTAMVRDALARHLPATLHVVGEIGDLSRPGSGHLYLTLKDAQTELRAVMWRSNAARLRFDLRPGMEVVATGSIEVYEPRGTYQLIVRRIEPRGVGALELAFRQLKEKLAGEGLFDPARKRPLPPTPFRVALVTSPRGAALRDMLRTLERRFPRLEILLWPVAVQGEGAAQQIAAAIRSMNVASDALGGIDVAIVGRGGGSLEDLWAFNEEIVARAVAASAIPIVSAVGHETDVSICDFVADVRAATPTAAAELVTPLLSDVLAGLDDRQRRAARVVRHGLELRRARLDAMTSGGWLGRPLLKLRQRGQLVDELLQRLRHAVSDALQAARGRLAAAELTMLRCGSPERFGAIGRRLDGMTHRLERAWSRRHLVLERRLMAAAARLARGDPATRQLQARQSLDHAQARLAAALRHVLAAQRARLEARLAAAAACDPQRVLARGFSVTRDARTRRVIRSVAQVRDGTRIVTQVADGEFRSTTDDPRQPGLFDS